MFEVDMQGSFLNDTMVNIDRNLLAESGRLGLVEPTVEVEECIMSKLSLFLAFNEILDEALLFDESFGSVCFCLTIFVVDSILLGIRSFLLLMFILFGK